MLWSWFAKLFAKERRRCRRDSLCVPIHRMSRCSIMSSGALDVTCRRRGTIMSLQMIQIEKKLRVALRQ